jgi:hypothetical protein
MTPDEILYVHVTGTDQSQPLPRAEVLAAIAQGSITQSQLIWSPADSAWKPVREIPDLQPQPPRTIPVARPAIPVAAARERPKTSSVKISQVVARAAPAQTSIPSPRVVTAAEKAGRRTGKSVVVDEKDDGVHILRWLCAIPGILIVVLVALNYFLVDGPLVSALRQSAFPTTTVYAHLGAFVQPNALVIHIPSNSAITRDTLPDFLLALARSTPADPLGGAFTRVSLTTGWTGRYTFSGPDWKQLGDMSGDSEDGIKAFLLDHAGDAAGAGIIPPRVKVNGQWVDQRDKAWNDFVHYFTAY